MLASEMQQQLFRALSNRTRTKPNDIYSKMSAQINTLQDQVLLFNQMESQVPNWLRKQTNKLGGEPRSISLKSMTQPKYQNLLVDCELPQNDNPNLKNSKLLLRKFSQRNKDPKNSTFGSTSKSFKAMFGRSKVQSGFSKFWGGKVQSRVKESTMIQTLAQESVPMPQNKSHASKKDFNISVTESIIFPEKPKAVTTEVSRSKAITLRQQITRKQQVLWSEWQKTQRYHQQMSKWMGQQEADKMLKTMCPNSRVVGVIQKIRNSRPESCRIGDFAKRSRIKSEQL